MTSDDRLQLLTSSTGLSPTLAAMLAYGGWWVSGLLFWWVERRDTYVRFHAAQSVVAFGLVALFILAFGILAVVSLSMLPGAFTFFVVAAGVTWLAGLLLCMAAMWNAAKGREWRMPVVGHLAMRMAGVRK